MIRAVEIVVIIHLIECDTVMQVERRGGYKKYIYFLTTCFRIAALLDRRLLLAYRRRQFDLRSRSRSLRMAIEWNKFDEMGLTSWGLDDDGGELVEEGGKNEPFFCVHK